MAQLQKVIAAADTAAKVSGAEQAQALKEVDTRRATVNQSRPRSTFSWLGLFPRVPAVPS